MLTNNLYSFESFSKIILSNTISFGKKVIGITGPSCIGKSTLANYIKNCVKEHKKVSVIHVDNYLKKEYRGQHQFRKNVDEVLNPSFFDWQQLRSHIFMLQNSEDVEIDIYTRGEGWGQKQTLVASELLIIEGLFIDSVEATQQLPLNLLIVLKADRDLLYNNRKKRDAYYNSFHASFRNERDTQSETMRTFFADRSYDRADISCAYIEAFVTQDFMLNPQKIQNLL